MKHYVGASYHEILMGTNSRKIDGTHAALQFQIFIRRCSGHNIKKSDIHKRVKYVNGTRTFATRNIGTKSKTHTITPHRARNVLVIYYWKPYFIYERAVWTICNCEDRLLFFCSGK